MSAPVLQSGLEPKKTKLANLFEYTPPRTKPAVNPRATTSAKYNVHPTTSTSHGNHLKSDDRTRLNQTYQKPFMKISNYGISTSGFAKPSLAHSSRSKGNLPPGHFPQTNLHTPIAADDNFDRLSQLDVTDDTRGAHRSRRRRDDHLVNIIS